MNENFNGGRPLENYNEETMNLKEKMKEITEKSIKLEQENLSLKLKMKGLEDKIQKLTESQYKVFILE